MIMYDGTSAEAIAIDFPLYNSITILTVPLNYNFIFTRVHTRGAMQYFACQMPKFPVEIQISTR